MNGNAETSSVSPEVEDLKMVPVPQFHKKMRLPKIFNYYYIIDTSDPTGKSLRAMCKTCETTICYSRRATSNLITHLKRKHPMNYADYAELQPPGFLTGGHSPFLTTTSNSMQASDARGDPIIFQVQGGAHNPQQMMELSKPQYQSMDGIPSQPVSLSENGVYGAFVPASTEAGMPHVVSVHGMHYAVTTENSHHESNTHPIHMKRSSNFGDNQSNTSQSSTPQQSVIDGDVSGNTMTDWNHEIFDSKDWLMLFMADTMLPSSIVANSNFRGFIKSLNQRFVLPSEEILTNEWMPQKQDHVKRTIMDLLDEIHDVCLIVTKWQQSQEQFFVTFTMCFIKDWTFRKVFLACKIFFNDPPNDVINGIIQDLEEEFGLSGKITQRIMEKGITDVEQLNLPGFLDATATVGQATDERDEKPEILEKDKVDGSSSEQWLSSFEQALHNCITDGLRDVQQISACISKLVQSLKVGLPNGRKTPDHEEDGTQSQAIGWLQQIKFLKAAVDDTISSSDKVLSDSETKLLGEFLDTLEPFEDAMDYILKHQENIPISFAVPCIHGLQRHLQPINRSHCQRLLFQLKASLAKNFCKFEASQMCKFAAALDPRFKMNWCSQSEAFSLKQSLLKTSLKTAQKFNIHSSDVHQSEEVEEDAGNTSKLFKLMGSPQQSRPNIQHTKVQEEVNNYLSLPCTKNTTDPLLYWKMHKEEYPTLAQLASSILCIPAASPIKSNEVMAIGVPLLKDLPNEQLERLIFLRNNASLF